jgi:hypothetical protein
VSAAPKSFSAPADRQIRLLPVQQLSHSSARGPATAIRSSQKGSELQYGVKVLQALSSGTQQLYSHCVPLRSVALWCIAIGRPSFGSDRQSTCTMRFWVISQLAQLRIGAHLDYSVMHGPESLPPAYAAPEMRPLAPDHSAGSASDVSLGPPSGCRA